MEFFLQRMLKKIFAYRQKGIIDEDCAEKISAQINAEIKRRRSGRISFAWVATALVGVFAIGLGAYRFVTSVWDYLSLQERTIVAFLPLLLSGIFAAFVVLGKKSPLLRECAALGNIFGVICAVIVNVNIYQIDISNANQMFALMCLFFPLAFILNSSVALLASVASFFIIFDNSRSEFVLLDFQIPVYLFVGAIFFIFSWRGLKKNNGIVSLFYASSLLIMVAAFLPALESVLSCRNYYFRIPMSALYGGFFILFGVWAQKIGIFVRAISIFIFVILISTVAGVDGQFLSYAKTALTKNFTVELYWYCAIIAAMVGLYVYAFYNAVKSGKSEYCWTFSSLLAPLICVYSPIVYYFPQAGHWFAFAGISAVSLLIVFKSLKELSQLNLNVGLLYLCVLSMSEFYGRNLSSLVVSLLLVGLGALIITMNATIYVRLKR